jgi:hypothetical protein
MRIRKEESYLQAEPRRVFDSLVVSGVDPDLALEILDLLFDEKSLYRIEDDNG